MRREIIVIMAIALSLLIGLAVAQLIKATTYTNVSTAENYSFTVVLTKIPNNITIPNNTTANISFSVKIMPWFDYMEKNIKNSTKPFSPYAVTMNRSNNSSYYS